MLSRFISLRSLRVGTLANYNLHRPRSDATCQHSCIQPLLPPRSLNFCLRKADFSVSASTSGIFDFWNKSNNSSGEVAEKVYIIEDATFSNGENIESVNDEANINISRTFEGQNSEITQSIDSQIPGETAIAEETVDFTGTVDNLPETLTSFADFGLGGGIMPHRLFQDVLEYLTNSMGLEWIPAIAILTIIARIATVPGNIGIRRHSAKTHNHFPETMKMMEEIQKAAAEGNKFKMKKAQMEYMEFMRTSGISPVRPLLINLPNMIIFSSMFFGIRQMCIAKLPTLVNGGALWFTNLTIPDPYMILPLLSCVSMSMIIRSGAAEAEMGAMANMDGFRKILMWIPMVSLPFLVFQPAAMFAFWVVSNCFTVALMLILRNQKVQRFLKIPEREKHNKTVSKAMENAMNPIEIFRKAKETRKQQKVLFEKLKKHQGLIKRMKEQEKLKKKS